MAFGQEAKCEELRAKGGLGEWPSARKLLAKGEVL